MRSTVILNVDDTQGVRYVRTHTLTQAGFRVQEAASGVQALEMLAAEPPDLVILDVNLPDISGYEICRRIKASRESATIPVLHISAIYHDDAARVAALEAGAEAYLTEPVEPAVLVATAKALLRVRRMHQDLEAEVERRSRAEEALRSSNRRLQLLSELANDLLSDDAAPEEFVTDLYKRFSSELGLEVYLHYQVRCEVPDEHRPRLVPRPGHLRRAYYATCDPASPSGFYVFANIERPSHRTCTSTLYANCSNHNVPVRNLARALRRLSLV